jgi:hypothetical protein
VALIRTDVSEDHITSIFWVHECDTRMEAIRSSETSVLIRATRCHLPEDDNHHSHRRGNLKSYKGKVVSLTRRPSFAPQKDSWYSFLLEAESTPGSYCGWKD